MKCEFTHQNEVTDISTHNLNFRKMVLYVANNFKQVFQLNKFIHI